MAFNQLLRSSVPKISPVLANRTFFTYSNCISQPLPDRTPAYVEAREAVKCIKSGKNAFSFITWVFEKLKVIKVSKCNPDLWHLINQLK
jgi:hypothetical protein